MNRARAIILLFLLISASSCCLDMGGKEKRYRKNMLCARRVNNDNAMFLLKKGAFCCPHLPPGVSDISSARRFYYMKASEIFPERDEPVEAIARTFWEEGLHVEALGYYEKALGLSPGNINDLVAVITLRRICGKFDQAIETLSPLEKADFEGKKKSIDYLRGKIVYEQGDLGRARELFSNALDEIEKNDGSYYLGPTPFTMKDIYFYMALIELKGREPQKAHEYFLKYLSKEGHPDFVSTYQECLKQSGGEQEFLYGLVEERWARTHQ